MIKKRQILSWSVMLCLILVLVLGISVGCSKELPNETSDIEETAPTDQESEDLVQRHPVIVALPGDDETTETTTLEQTTSEPETTTEEETTTAEPEPSVLDGYVLADVKLYLNVRQEPSTESEILGKLYVGDLATILETGEEWTYITSGNVTGYVSNEYIVTGKAAEEYIIEEGLYVAKTTVSGLRIRKEPNTECEYYCAAYKGQTFAALGEATDGWVPIRYQASDCPSGVAYLSAEYVELSCELGEAITIEEEKEQIRLAEEAKRKAEEEARIKRILEACVVVPVANREPFSFSDADIYLLACLVYTEAGVEPYEGKLAVANVVLNRYLQGYGDTLTEIIYAKNQFAPAASGSLEKCLENGPSESCVRAAKEAVAGVNNIGDYCHFITTKKANYELYTEYTIINRHCFYKRDW